MRLQGQIHYWEDEIRRRERDLRVAKEDTKNGSEEATELSKTTYGWQQRLKYLSTVRGSGKGSSQLPPPGLATEEGSPSPGGTPDSPSPGVSRSLAVTERATAALLEILNGMPHESAQSLRLLADSSGNITLTPDTARASDVVVTHNGEAVLLIESPLPSGLEGATLDVGDFAAGPEITLSR